MLLWRGAVHLFWRLKAPHVVVFSGELDRWKRLLNFISRLIQSLFISRTQTSHSEPRCNSILWLHSAFTRSTLLWPASLKLYCTQHVAQRSIRNVTRWSAVQSRPKGKDGAACAPEVRSGSGGFTVQRRHAAVENVIANCKRLDLLFQPVSSHWYGAGTRTMKQINTS